MGGIKPVIAILMGKLWQYQGRRGGGGLQLKPLIQSNLDFFADNFSFPSSSPPLAFFLLPFLPLLPLQPPTPPSPPPLVWQCPVLDGEIGGTTRSNDPSHSTTKFLRKFKAGQLMDRPAVCTALLDSDRGNKLTRNRLQV